MNIQPPTSTSLPRVISVREFPAYTEPIIRYIQSKWSSVPALIYRDCIENSLNTASPLPQWYVLEKDNQLIGCAGLVSNDFISRMDLMPWLCALYVEEEHRCNGYASLLLEKARTDAYRAGYEQLYLSTGHIGFYEKKGYTYLGQGYHPWGEESRIYGRSAEMDRLIPLILHKTPPLPPQRLHKTFTMRNEQPDEFPEIYAFIRTAFETAAVKDGDEQDFISRLRDSENYLPRLAWVAHKQQELVGHLMLTRTDVKYADQPILRSLTVAALSVKLFYRNKGVGTALMEEGLRQAYTEGYSAIFLCGDPAYYYRFGFKPISSYGITNTGTVPPPYVLACELIPGILTGKEETGTVCF